LKAGVRCDEVGCIGGLKDGRLVSMAALAPEAFSEDYARATVVISAREAPAGCAAILIDRNVWRSQGAIALRWASDRFEMSAARPRGYARPWARAPALTASTSSPMRPVLPDATPINDDWTQGINVCHSGPRAKRAGPESILRSTGVMDSGLVRLRASGAGRRPGMTSFNTF
jgi:competence protein ComEC